MKLKLKVKNDTLVKIKTNSHIAVDYIEDGRGIFIGRNALEFAESHEEMTLYFKSGKRIVIKTTRSGNKGLKTENIISAILLTDITKHTVKEIFTLVSMNLLKLAPEKKMPRGKENSITLYGKKKTRKKIFL